MGWQQRYLDRFYSRAKGWVDGTTEFHSLVDSTVAPGSRILEIGPGPSNPTSRFLASKGSLIGVDIDAESTSNDALTEAYVIENDRYPLPDASLDACVSNYVVEHVKAPAAHLREIHRVLVPGGVYVFRTPNQFHYVALIARFTPHWFHKLVANRVRNRQGQHDPYPTVYAMNTVATVRRFASEQGFTVREIHLVEKEPSYAMFSRAAFVALVAYERVVNSTPLLAGLRANLFVALEKPR